MLGSNVSVGQCLTENQLFDESVEDLAYVAGLSTVEAKGEFVEVALEMHFTHLPLQLVRENYSGEPHERFGPSWRPSICERITICKYRCGGDVAANQRFSNEATR